MARELESPGKDVCAHCNMRGMQNHKGRKNNHDTQNNQDILQWRYKKEEDGLDR